MILTVTMNAAIDKTVNVAALKRNDVIRASSTYMYGGGKGVNVARALHSLGYKDVIATGFQGGYTGRMITELIEAEGIRTDFVFCRQPTRISLLIHELDSDSYIAIYEPGIQVYPDEINLFKSKFSTLIKEADLCIFSGSVPCPELRNIYYECIIEAHKAGVTCFLDAHGEEFKRGIEAGPYLIKPNLEEMFELLDINNREESVDEITAFYMGLDTGVPFVVISLGENGAIAGTKSEGWRVRTPTIRAVNPVGSGDAMVAGLALGLLKGCNVREMICLGVAAGTANCLMWGAGFLRREDVDQLLSELIIERLS